jgi:hypothetical protein
MKASLLSELLLRETESISQLSDCLAELGARIRCHAPDDPAVNTMILETISIMMQMFEVRPGLDSE